MGAMRCAAQIIWFLTVYMEIALILVLIPQSHFSFSDTLNSIPVTCSLTLIPTSAIGVRPFRSDSATHQLLLMGVMHFCLRGCRLFCYHSR